MNSREKQRRAMHAKGGALARVRQLPLYMKIINVVLAVVLALGVGANWAYAAELLPEGNEAVTLPQDSSKTLTAASVAKSQANESVTYGWQILDQSSGKYVEIAGEVGSSLNVNYAMIANELDASNMATIRSVVYDSSENVIAQKDYYVTADMNIQPIEDAVAANALADFPGGTTLYAEGEANDPVNAPHTITINYVDGSGKVLLTNSKDFEEGVAIKWFVQLPGGYETHDATTTSTEINIAYEEPDQHLAGLYITSKTATGITSDVVINAVVSADLHPYSIIAEYETTTAGVYDEPETIAGGRGQGGELGTPIPTEDDITHLTTDVHGKGWSVSYQEAGKTVRENPATVSVKLARTYSVLYFDLGEDGINGPIAVYIKQGVSFDTVKSWKQGDVYLPAPTPFRNAYEFDHWYYVNDDGQQVAMPTDNWAKDNNPAPGTDTTYYASWRFKGQDDTKVTVVLAYWGEMSEAGGQYEYLEERYAQVPYSQITNGYVLPIYGNNQQQWAGAYHTGDRYNDRRYPQNRQIIEGEESQFDLLDSVLNVPNVADLHGNPYQYDDLYYYTGDTTHIWSNSTNKFIENPIQIKADGSTVINISLKRKVFRLGFGETEYSWRQGYYLDDAQYIFGRWGQKTYGTFHSKGSAEDKVIQDPRDPDNTSKYQYGYLYMRNYYENSRWQIINDGEEITTAASLFAYMPYDSSAEGWITNHTPQYPYSPSTSPADFYWGGLDCGTYDLSTSNLLRYYLQTCGATFMHWGRDSGHSGSLSNRIDTLKLDLKAADSTYGSSSKKYQTNFGESTTYGVGDGNYSFSIGSNSGSNLVNVFVDFLGFQSLIAPDSSHPELQQRGYDSPLRGGNDADPGATSGNSQGRSGGWSFYYKRNEFPLYIKNIYGSEPIYDDKGQIVSGHYDYCIQFNDKVQYATPIDKIIFNQGGADGYEQGEPVKDGEKVEGLTKIKNGDSLKDMGFVSQTALLDVPESQDQHLVFEGWYEDSGFASRIDFSTWKMPNHQQDIYAHWVKPQLNIRYHYTYPTEDYDLSEIETYDEEHITHQPKTPETDATHRFVSWYYWTSDEHTEDNKVYFNPSYMRMPFVSEEFGSAPDTIDKDGNARVLGEDYVNAPTLDLYPEYTVETNTEYTFKFMLENSETEVAPASTGRCDYYIDEQHTGDHPSFNPTTMVDSDFYIQYRGIIEPVDKSTFTFEKIVADPTQNVHTFYFKYNKTFEYKEVWQFAKTDGTYQTFYETDWTPSGNEGHDVSVTAEVPADQRDHPTIDGVTYPVKIRGTYTVTLNLVAGEHPDDNIIYFNFDPDEPVDFYYKTASFAKVQEGATELTGVTGGSVTPTMQEDFPVIPPEGVFSSSTATAYNGFKFVGWYAMGADGKIDLTKRITTDAVINAPKDANGFYMTGATYFAAFEYGGTITINYQVRAATSIDAAGNPQGEIDVPESTVATPEYETNSPVGYTFTGSTVTLPSGFYAYRWVDGDNNIVKPSGSTDMNKYVPTAVSTSHGYNYYEADTYTLWIVENSADKPVITYKVKSSDPDQSTWGDVALNSSTQTKAKTVTETLSPYTGVAVGAIATPTSVAYKFVKWTNEDGSQTVSTDASWKPTKPGDVWVPATYVAVFDFNDVAISFITDGNGQLTDGETTAATINKTSTVSDTYTVESATAATDPGKITFDGKYDYTIKNIPYFGYKFKEWVLVVDGEEVPLPQVSERKVTGPMTFKAKFEEEAVVLTYVPVDTAQGLVKEAGGNPRESVQQNITNCVTGTANKVTAIPGTGYKFDYWTIDSATTSEHYCDTAEVQVDQDTQDGHSAYRNHTLYAHFKTYKLNVNFTIHESWTTGDATLSCEKGGESTQTEFEIDSTSTFTYQRVVEGSDPAYGLFKIYAPGVDQVEGNEQIIEKIVAKESTMEYLSWLRDIGVSPAHSYVSLPQPPIFNEPETTVYTIAGVLQQREGAEYTVKYWQEKVSAAITGTHTYTDEYYDIVEGDTVVQKGTSGSDMVYDAKSYKGFDLVYVNPEAGTADRKIKPDGSSVLNIYYDRQDDYPIIFRSQVQTAESALHPEDPPEFENTWTSEEDFITGSGTWHGIYGAPFIVFDAPFGARAQEIIYDHTSPLYISSGAPEGVVTEDNIATEEFSFLKEYWDHNKETYGSAHFYRVGDRVAGLSDSEYPGKGVCDVHYLRPTNWPFYVSYHRQNVSQTGWETNEQIMPFTSVNAETKTIVQNGALLSDYDFSSSTQNIPNPEDPTKPVKWVDYLRGFHYNSCDPSSGKVTTDSWGAVKKIYKLADGTLTRVQPTDPYAIFTTHAVMDIYYTRNDDTVYKIDYYQETAASAVARYNTSGTKAKETDYEKVEGDTDTLKGVTGATVPINVNATKYAGFQPATTTDSEVTSDTQIEIKPDGTAVAKVYYTRNITGSTNFKVNYYLQDLNESGTGGGTSYTLQADTKAVAAPAGAKIAVQSTATQELTGMWTKIYKDYSAAGYHINDDKSKTESTGAQGYEVVNADNSTIVKLYYDRDNTNKVTVKFMKETINTATWVPTGLYEEDVPARFIINGGGESPTASVVTGANFKFNDIVSDNTNKYRNGETGEQGFVFAKANPDKDGSGNYYLKVKVDTTGNTNVIELYYDRIEKNIPVTINYLGKNLDSSEYEYKLCEPVTTKLSTGQKYSAPQTQFAGWKFVDKEGTPIEYAYPYKADGSENSYVINMYYDRLTNVMYKVETYYETVEHAKGEAGADEWKLEREISSTGTTGDEINKNGIYTPQIQGFKYGGGEPQINIEPLGGQTTINGDGSSVFRVYYSRIANAAGATIEVYLENWEYAVYGTGPDYTLKDTITKQGFLDETFDLTAEDFLKTYTNQGYTWNSGKSAHEAVYKIVNDVYKVYFDCAMLGAEGLTIRSHFETLDSAVNHKDPAHASDPRQFETTGAHAPKTKKIDSTAENKLYVGRICSMIEGDEFIAVKDPALWSEGFYFDGDYNAGNNPDNYPYYTIHVNLDGANPNVVDIYYLRDTNITFTVHYMVEIPASYDKTKDKTGAHWDEEVATVEQIIDNQHVYSDQRYSPYSGQFTYEYVFDLTDPVNWSVSVPGYACKGYKDYQKQKINPTAEGKVEAPVHYNPDENHYYIYYTLDASEEFYVEYYLEDYDSAVEGKDPKTFTHDSSLDTTFHTYFRKSTDDPKNPITIEYMDPITMEPLQKVIPGFTYIPNSMVPAEQYIEQGQSKEQRTVKVYYSRDYYNPPDSYGYRVNYYFYPLGSDGKPVLDHDQAVWQETVDFDAVFGEEVFVAPKDKALAQESDKGHKKLVQTDGVYKDYTFNDAMYVNEPSEQSFIVTGVHDPDQTVNVYYTPKYYDPSTTAFTAHYMFQTVDEARAGHDDPATYADKYVEGTTGVTSPDLFGGYFGATVKTDYTDPVATPSHSFVKTVKGFTNTSYATYKETPTTAAVVFNDQNPFEIKNTHQQHVYFYFNREYYEPPTQVGYTVKYMGYNEVTKAYDIPLKNDIVTTNNGLDFEAFFGETISNNSSDKNYYGTYVSADKHNVKVKQNFQFWTESKTKAAVSSTGWPMVVTDQSVTTRPVITIYYDPDYIPPSPDPKESGLTVYYKGLSLDAAKTKDPSTYVEADYTEDLANKYVSDGKLTLGANMNALINKDYIDTKIGDPAGKLLQTFEGFSTMNGPLTKVGTETKGLEFSFNITGKGATVTLYYNRDVYDPPSGDTGYYIVHMVQSLDYLITGEGDEYVEERTDNIKAVYNETVYGSYDTNTDMKAKIDKFEEDHMVDKAEGIKGFTFNGTIDPEVQVIKAPNTHKFYVYYDRGFDSSYTFGVQKMIKNPDFILGKSDVAYLPYGDVETVKPFYQQPKVDATCTNIWTPIDGYFFENRCEPNEIIIPEENNLLTASNEEEFLGTINGFYDLVEYPQPEYVNGQTGDEMFALAGVIALVGLVSLGLFLGLSRRKKTYSPKH